MIFSYVFMFIIIIYTAVQSERKVAMSDLDGSMLSGMLHKVSTQSTPDIHTRNIAEPVSVSGTSISTSWCAVWGFIQKIVYQ